mmetsp:Transcript_6498/g.13317  ORF Transcript_6498/g.13317 Transcript_6498/m.13317 type:complete len:84 (+) Transcript_6498:31-282(+)
MSLAHDDEADLGDSQEALDILFEMSTLLNTGLNKETVSAILGLCELGVNPEAIAKAVQELRDEASRLQEQEAGGNVPPLPRGS